MVLEVPCEGLQYSKVKPLGHRVAQEDYDTSFTVLFLVRVLEKCRFTARERKKS